MSAPPGAGKSTLLPLCLLDEPWLEGRKIYMLEPRRLAARSIASRMASMIGEEPGQTVGYRIKFESRVGPGTRLEVLTEGILTRMLQSDNSLQDAGLVIFDEFHERSLNADLALALCREAQQILRPDIRILVMSATLDSASLGKMLEAKTLQSEGRLFPVTVHYTGDTDLQILPSAMCEVILKAMASNPGDVLAFLPGEGEITKCADLLKRRTDALVLPLYGRLSASEQSRTLVPDKLGRRKIVLATSIAETSLTIEGVRIVVDSGFGKVSAFDPASELSSLKTIRITRDSAAQRAGRAGRLSEGVCYRMWTTATEERMQEHRVPEILEADMAPLVLELAAWGISEPDSLAWIDTPPKAAVARAKVLLADLQAVENGKITTHGREMHRLGTHPRIAHMLLMAGSGTEAALACDIAALLEERDPLPRESGIDLSLRVEALRRSRLLGKPNPRMKKIIQASENYCRLIKADFDNGSVDPHLCGKLVARAYPERIASARPGNNAMFQLANGKLAMAGHTDDLARESWLAVASIDMREGVGKIFLAAPLDPQDLKDMLVQRDSLSWDTRKGGLFAVRELRIGALVLQSKPLPNPDPGLVKAAILQAIHKEGERLLYFNDAFVNLQNRIQSLRIWNPEEGWPDVSNAALISKPELWLGAYLSNVRTAADLMAIPLTEALQMYVGWDRMQILDTHAPAKIRVPSGSMIPLKYWGTGAAPVLSVRLQEVFGMSDTPRVNAGKTPVLLHLLSPGYKPVQVTSDLRSFWNNTYYEVRKELRRRYPKHAWPEDPWKAEAVAKGRSVK